MQNFRSYFRTWSRAESGMTLVEVLVATAITAMVSTVITSLLVSMMGTGKRLRQDTDGYESLRLAATVFMQDARFATRVYCYGDAIKLEGTTSSNYIIYKFAAWDDDPYAGSPDLKHLHRWVVQGGAWQRDDVVGWDLLPPDGSADTTWFGCTSTPTQRMATLHLVKPSAGGGAPGAHLEVTGYLR